MYGYYTDHLYIASVDGLPEYTGDTVTSAITLYDNDLRTVGIGTVAEHQQRHVEVIPVGVFGIASALQKLGSTLHILLANVLLV